MHPISTLLFSMTFFRVTNPPHKKSIFNSVVFLVKNMYVFSNMLTYTKVKINIHSKMATTQLPVPVNTSLPLHVLFYWTSSSGLPLDKVQWDETCSGSDIITEAGNFVVAIFEWVCDLSPVYVSIVENYRSLPKNTTQLEDLFIMRWIGDSWWLWRRKREKLRLGAF